MSDSPEQLGQDIFGEISLAAADAKRWARQNYFCAYFISGVIVVASITAGLTVGLDELPKWTRAALASLPAVMLTASTVFRFEQKSAWFWKKSKALEALVRRLKYESVAPHEASQLFSQIEESMEKDWVSFGTVGKANS
ncbi:hypothetical protein AB4Z19_11575 [Pseudoduganella sp. RAF19]|uniref:hypothetical protein n=1 Tax=Pseudoduganella sp. RAF19 TaxID=3233052 RepID=UPI003F978274